jgi:CheY-like chemotaxis protein
LTSQLLAFSRRQVARPRPVEVGEALRELDTLMRPLLGEGVQLVLRLAPEPLWVTIDPGQLEQVVMNLAINARDAMREGGELRIGCRTVQLDGEPPGTPPGLRAGRYVRIEVADQGTGMGPEVLARLFEPFFTTKEKGRGTGLGLPTVQDIVSRAGGAITVDTELGRGSTFAVFLPAHRAPTGEAPAPLAGAPAGAGRSVLVVDDDPSVLELTRTILAEEGFAVHCAQTGREALEVARSGGELDLLVADLLLPDMQGEELARQVREARPATRVLFVSGALREPRAAAGPGAGSARLLAKPFRREGLLAEVRAALDGTELVAGR